LSNLRVLIAANGTGGHIIPVLDVARELVTRHSDEVLFSGAGFADNYPRLAHNLYSIKQAGMRSRGRVLKAVERVRESYASATGPYRGRGTVRPGTTLTF